MSMNDLPREILKEMVTRYGSSLAQDPVRCEGLLRDSCSRCNREIFVIVNAARQRIPADLIAPRHALPLPLMKGFLAKRLQDELGFSDEAARWAVESWAEALGIVDSGAPGRRVKDPAIPGEGSIPSSAGKYFPGETARYARWVDDLRTGTLSLRIDAVTGLSHAPGPDCLRALIKALDNSMTSIRGAAFDAIASRGAPAVPLLVEALADKSEGIVWRSALLLGGMNAENAGGPLIGLLDRNGRVQICAIWALGEIRSREAITPLMKFIDHADPAIRKEAEMALEKIGRE